jgi:hypothetical protein
MAVRAALESLLEPSNLGCAPSLWRNPPLASVGGDVSEGPLWAKPGGEHSNATVPQRAMARLINRHGLNGTYTNSRSNNQLFSPQYADLSNKNVVSSSLT